MLLTPKDRLHPEVAELIDADLVERVVIMGGTLSEAVEAAVEGLRDSPPHLSNMINSEFTGIGIGIAVGERKIMVTQNFSSFSDEPVETPPAHTASAWPDIGWRTRIARTAAVVKKMEIA